MSTQSSPARLLLTGIALTYVFGVGAYFGYGFLTNTGLSGWLSTWQMQAFGEADQRFTFLGTTLVWLLGAVGFITLQFRLNKTQGFAPSPPPVQPAAAWPLRSRLLAAGVVLAITGIVYGYFVQRDAHLATQPVRQLDLSQTETLPPDAELANIRGVVAANYLFVVEEKGSSGTVTRNGYAPLLPASWQPGQPVRYILKTQATAYADPHTHQVAWLDSGRAFVATYDGRLSTNDLPTFVAQDYSQRQLTLASPYYVLDDEAVYDGHAVLSSEFTRWMIAGCGLLFAVLLLVRRNYR